MCDPSANSTANCQPEEFFYGSDGALSQLSGIPTIAFDFQPPLIEVEELTVEPADGGVVLHWELPITGDIQGFRVLCEEAATGASPGLDFPTPELGEVPNNNHYFTAGNLCGAQPFSTVKTAPADVTDPDTCGNGVVEDGEACDDGDDNGPEGLCDESCELRVSPSLHALDWDHVCSDHISFNNKGMAIHGLENGKAYNFVLVSYDLFGNPRVHDQVVTATPDGSLPGPDGGLEEIGGEAAPAPRTSRAGRASWPCLSARSSGWPAGVGADVSRGPGGPRPPARPKTKNPSGDALEGFFGLRQ
ncbi:hypothetical protein [Nannocystis pusilla]|uniref:hypothetical protein n=1 Tax=Nannocystis pusilla TaxID=889268 RepID=UPI003B7EB2CE